MSSSKLLVNNLILDVSFGNTSKGYWMTSSQFSHFSSKTSCTASFTGNVCNLKCSEEVSVCLLLES